MSIILTTFTPASASYSQFGSISLIHGMPNGAMIFTHDGARTATPSCATGATATRWAINATTDGGKLQASMLLSAYALNKKIVVLGTGTCSAWGDTETVDYIIIE
ncbi:hypothetical protein TS85_00185 [Sphingomonas hengshuiensis]|uniref:Uncharacterized protein n=1 Tax=Sphingomonas hengshuiensis TaxID=1609977 RepID=A0A7U5BE12_9SPHN|nr:hypothetical protein TS85_00185 [Sphingomonas hengshuiensis]